MGPSMFRQAMDLYFSRNDGRAASCEDFQAAMADASGRDFSQFVRWYSRAGTPEVEVVRTDFDESRQQFRFTVRQTPPPLSVHELAVQGTDALLLHIPLKVGLIGKKSGADMIEGKTLVRTRNSCSFPVQRTLGRTGEIVATAWHFRGVERGLDTKSKRHCGTT